MAKDQLVEQVIAIGGSAGSLDVILKIIPDLPYSSTISFLFILHRKSDAESTLADLFASRTKLKVKEVEDKDRLTGKTIFIAPPDYHLLLEGRESFSLDSSEKIQYSRPSIDVSFESVAYAFGKQSAGVLLSGANADGAEGLQKIKEAGGVTIAQNPLTAEVGYMPQQAINKNIVDKVLDGDEIGKYICQLLLK